MFSTESESDMIDAMLSDADVELLETVAQDGTMNYEEWPALLEPFLEQLYHIAHYEFPIPQVRSSSFETVATLPLHSAVSSQEQSSSQANSNKENAPPSQSQSPPPTTRPPVPAFSPTPSARAADTQSQSSFTDGGLPEPLHCLLHSIESTLKESFSVKPPHTIQRLAELILRPTRHYRTLPAYLRAVDRVVSVSTGADVFPLPVNPPLNQTYDPGFPNGINGLGPTFSLFTDTSLGTDEALGGARLTPIPWLINPTSTSDDEGLPADPDSGGEHVDVDIIAQSESDPETPDSSMGDELPTAEDIIDEGEESPHARGPVVLGVEDMGLQDGKDVQMSLSTTEADASATEDSQMVSSEVEKKEGSQVGADEDGEGEIVVEESAPAPVAKDEVSTDMFSGQSAAPATGGTGEADE